MGADFVGVNCRFRTLCLLGVLASPAATFDTGDVHVHAWPDRDVAGLAHPAPCGTPTCELAAGVAAEVRDLVVLARQLQLAAGSSSQPFAEQLLAIAARIAARLDQSRGAPAARVVPGGGTVYGRASPQDAGNATRARALELRGGPGRAEPGGTLPGVPAPQIPGEVVPPAPVMQAGALPSGWGISDPRGGSNHSVSWDRPIDPEKEEYAIYALAVVFVGIIASAPVYPHLNPGAPPPTKAHYCECFCLFVWLFSGLYLFTHEILFQSPHFEMPRTLRLEESVYLISQIVTTVGYGDVTPAQISGQLVIGFYCFVSTILVTQILSDLVNSFENVVETRLSRTLSSPRTLDDAAAAAGHRQRLWAAFLPVVQSGTVYLCFVILGLMFFCLYPGEGKTFGQAVYMSTITLSTVGFGAFTPVTHTGMVFAAYWMLFGVGSLGALVSARVAFSSSLVRYEREMDSEEPTGQQELTLEQFESKIAKT